MVKKDAHNPIREKWVINHLREWDKEHPDLNNTISNINAEVAEFADCEFYPKCLEQDVNRCYIRKRTCLNIRKV